MTQKINYRIVFHVLVWGALVIVPYLFHPPVQKSFDVRSLPAGFFTAANILHIILFYLNAYWLYPRLFSKHKRMLYILSILGCLGISFLMKIWIIQIWFPAIPLVLSIFPFLFFSSFFFILIGTVYRQVLDSISQEKEQKARQAEQLATELKFLRSQISPHFLFNVLNSMVSMARKKSNLLEPSLITLAGLMRYMLYESDEKTVPLVKEVEYLKSYIDLQRIRFMDDVAIAVDIQHELGIYRIEPMLMIPFVENAFKHGIGWIEDPQIYIRLSVKEGILDLEVKNKYNQDYYEMKDNSPGIGLANVQSRLGLLYPQRHQLSIDREHNLFRIHLLLKLK